MKYRLIVQIILKKHVNYGNAFTSYINKISDEVFKDKYDVIFTDEDVELISKNVPILKIKFINERKIDTSVEVNDLNIINDLIKSLNYIIDNLNKFKEDNDIK